MAQASEGLAGEGRAAIYSVNLELFEGPLDLLLHLVRRHELDILDIPIAFVAEKYLEYLDLMRSLDLEIAGDYLVMAATLAWLKSRELLPAQPSEEQAASEDEEGEDPREALIRRLVEYERFKSAASELDALPVAGRDVFARGADIDVPPMDPGLTPVTLFRLAEAYYRVLTRAKIAKSHDVTIEAVTVAQRMQQLTLMLDEKQEFEFEALFLSRAWSSERELRGMLVVTLMSVLELVKLGVARVQQVPDTTAIRVYRLVASEEARRLVEAYDEEQSFGAPVQEGPPPPSEAELDAIEDEKLLAEALAGLTGEEDEEADDGVRDIAAGDAATLAAANVAGGEEAAAGDEDAALEDADATDEDADATDEDAALEDADAVIEEAADEHAALEEADAVIEHAADEASADEAAPLEEAADEDADAVIEDAADEDSALEDADALSEHAAIGGTADTAGEDVTEDVAIEGTEDAAIGRVDEVAEDAAIEDAAGAGAGRMEVEAALEDRDEVIARDEAVLEDRSVDEAMAPVVVPDDAAPPEDDDASEPPGEEAAPEVVAPANDDVEEGP
ncbi:MAG: segregation/condensation protein A [Myxococcales bacterium]|nr:segregation/condensation protein A [Myxococcales bacterium]